MVRSPRVQRGKWGSRRPRLFDLVVPLLALVGLYWFSASFFLAKRSLPHKATCEEAPELLRDILNLSDEEVRRVLINHDPTKGCWLDRRVDSLVILVVDALRFDFARYNLPLSVGARIEKMTAAQNLHILKKNQTTSSQLLQFVADPPTVTMQRLKGLTTGSLPTFADISGNFGGASIEEDSWVQQLKDTPFQKRGLKHPSRLGFVGDDTWFDLFPTQFEECFPFPSFNTRDLDTVDNGCLKELPRLLEHLRTTGERKDELEVVVSHFLGVDHVGHTYGPHDKHMHEKLTQMDVALSTTLDLIDNSKHCHLALIFGDHGMTEDGNHGGGTENEINAALFVHFSPACGEMPLDLAPEMGSKYIQEAFQSIHQIDLVPTISVLLGLPIPYGNLGGIAPSLLGYQGIEETTAALALNAAQVWRYFTVYSKTANRLPNLPELQEQLDEAIEVYKQALQDPNAHDSNAFYRACGLFKVFLAEASELGHRVWTRFDTVGMFVGGSILALIVLFWISSLYLGARSIWQLPRTQIMEVSMTVLFMLFQSGMLTFSNSYIEAEQSIVAYMMAVLGAAIFIRMNQVKAGGNTKGVEFAPLLIPLLSRLSESFVTGHGLDPSLRAHAAHSAFIFIPSLLGLLGLRILWFHSIGKGARTGSLHLIADVVTIASLAVGWLEKRSLDQTRNGYPWMRLSITILLTTIPLSIFESLPRPKGQQRTESDTHVLAYHLTTISKLLTLVMVVTGPATAATLLLVCLQGWMLYVLSGATGLYEVSLPVLACLWRLLVRHTFFATNHGCAFNRLQYSAAFVASMEFDFVLGGIQLFMNTFGWEIIGLYMVWAASRTIGKPMLWKWYSFFQLMEGFLNCISVSILRRHLMVWAVYAPRFLFSSIFLIMHCLGHILAYTLSSIAAV